MSIFKGRDFQPTSATAAHETLAQAGQPEQLATLMPPFAPQGAAPRTATAPGVVPPPAAPMYSFADADAEFAVAEKVRMARERAQASVQGSLRVAVERTRASATSGARRRAAQQAAPVAPRAARPHVRPSFDPVRAAQTGLLNLAWSWQEAGAPIRAIHAYMQVLARYPGTAAAGAAVADLVELSDKLAAQGQFHIALGIYDHLEELLACEE